MKQGTDGDTVTSEGEPNRLDISTRLASKKFGASLLFCSNEVRQCGARKKYRTYNEADFNARKERLMDILSAIFNSCNSYYGCETAKAICKTVIKVVEIVVNGKKETEKKES